MDKLKAIRLAKANEILEKSLLYLDGKDKELVSNVITSNNQMVDKYNVKTLSVINPTKLEVNTIRAAIRRSLYLKHGSRLVKELQAIHDELAHKRWDIEEKEFSNIDKYYGELDKWDKENDSQLKVLSSRTIKCQLAFEKIINNFKVSDEIITGKVLLKRQALDYTNLTKIENELNQHLLLQAETDFLNKYSNQLNKIKQQYETSKQ